MKVLLILSTLFLTSCSGFIGKFHKEFDKHDGKNVPVKQPDKFSMYRGSAPQGKRNQKFSGVNSRERKVLNPLVKRQYQARSAMRKRFKADDLNDNANDGSLWSEKNGNDGFLFTINNKKQIGDIILIQVFKRLKGEIQSELSRAFPAPKRKSKKSKKADAAAAGAGTPEGEEKTADAGGAGAPNNDKDPNSPFDKVSSIIVEEINNDHVLLRGRKSLLYRKRKRLVEIQALVARRDLTDEDSINSDQFLESAVQVVK